MNDETASVLSPIFDFFIDSSAILANFNVSSIRGANKQAEYKKPRARDGMELDD